MRPFNSLTSLHLRNCGFTLNSLGIPGFFEEQYITFTFIVLEKKLRESVNVILPVSEISYTETGLKIVTLATIGERFPEQHWLHVYTDGSATGADTNTGAEVYSRD
ncbi:hypothetical protein CEXT_533281 [Caerostris extrusa]|uniref:Uncharacterized protein n=1 Tax=Caerostris extrusa TaxID=172846 RepID=A0AAV4PSL3_CAEEX|nr:hypothetical protein CEXT_533281 [Caerostris extrusa]